MNNGEFQARTENLERLVEQVNRLGDEDARATALELMQSLLDMHGAAFTRVIEVLASSGEAGRAALLELADDPLVCGLLVLYGIHPLTLEDRVARAIEKLRRQLQKTGTELELVSVAEGSIHVRTHNPRPDGHSTASVRDRIEQSIREAAPEVPEIAIEGIVPSGFVPLNMVQPALNETGEAV
jgi:hypothetical protein